MDDDRLDETHGHTDGSEDTPDPRNGDGAVLEDDAVSDGEAGAELAAARVNRILAWVVVVLGLVLVGALGFVLWRVALPSTAPRSADEQDLFLAREAVERAPDDPNARVEYASALYRTGETEAAMRELETALSIQPELPTALYNLAVIRWYGGQRDGAIEALETLVTSSSNDQEAWFRLGVFREESGDLDGAAEAFQRAAELDPGDVAAHVRLGRALQELGRTDEARAEYEAALEYVPDYGPALEALSELGD